MARKDTITNDEADLLLYLADEMDLDARVALEARLRGDADLRQQLADLQAIDQVLVGLKSDAKESAFASRRALRSTLRVVRENALRPKYLDYASAARKRFRLPPYSVAAGIAILFTLGFIGWLYTTPPVTPGVQAISNNTPSFMPGNGGWTNISLSSGFAPVGVDEYGESSRAIDLELDALSLLADFEEGGDTQ